MLTRHLRCVLLSPCTLGRRSAVTVGPGRPSTQRLVLSGRQRTDPIRPSTGPIRPSTADLTLLFRPCSLEGAEPNTHAACCIACSVGLPPAGMQRARRPLRRPRVRSARGTSRKSATCAPTQLIPLAVRLACFSLPASVGAPVRIACRVRYECVACRACVVRGSYDVCHVPSACYTCCTPHFVKPHVWCVLIIPKSMIMASSVRIKCEYGYWR